jgi:hypothetical protein
MAGGGSATSIASRNSRVDLEGRYENTKRWVGRGGMPNGQPGKKAFPGLSSFNGGGGTPHSILSRILSASILSRILSASILSRILSAFFTARLS